MDITSLGDNLYCATIDNGHALILIPCEALVTRPSGDGLMVCLFTAIVITLAVARIWSRQIRELLAAVSR